MIKLGKFRAGLFCGAKIFSWRSWKTEGVKKIPRGFGVGPFIFWLDCTHENLRCLHGKEFNDTERRRWGAPGTEVARVACVDCGFLIYGVPRLVRCSLTGYTHSLSRM